MDASADPQIRRFVDRHMAEILSGERLFFNDIDSYVTFRYRGVEMAAQVFLCVEYPHAVVEYRIKTGKWVDRNKDLAQACASACWYRSTLEHPEKPFVVRFCYLHERFNDVSNTVDYQPTDEEVKSFVERASAVDYNIENCTIFQPTPSHDACRFCSILSLCTDYENFKVGERFDPYRWLQPPQRPIGIDVFLSHPSVIKDSIVKPFARKLEAEDISYWLDAENMGWGDRAASSINDGLAQSKYVIYFLNQAFFESHWSKAEFFARVSRDLGGDN